MALSHQTALGFAVTGVAILRVPAQGNFEKPAALAAGLSRALTEAGDVIPVYGSAI